MACYATVCTYTMRFTMTIKKKSDTDSDDEKKKKLLINRPSHYPVNFAKRTADVGITGERAIMLYSCLIINN